MNITASGRWKIWHEWERVSSGRRQIAWSRRRRDPSSAREVVWNVLLDSRGASTERADEEVATDGFEGEIVAEIRRADWYCVFTWRPGLVVDLLEAAELQVLTRPFADLGMRFWVESVGASP